jgi:hypothetical protein
VTQRQLEVVLSALRDAALYRGAGTASLGCRDCENVPAGRCAEHAKDNDRARGYAEVAAALSAGPVLAAGELPAAVEDGLAGPREIGGYRYRAPARS